MQGLLSGAPSLGPAAFAVEMVRSPEQMLFQNGTEELTDAKAKS